MTLEAGNHEFAHHTEAAGSVPYAEAAHQVWLVQNDLTGRAAIREDIGPDDVAGLVGRGLGAIAMELQ